MDEKQKIFFFRMTTKDGFALESVIAKDFGECFNVLYEKAKGEFKALCLGQIEVSEILKHHEQLQPKIEIKEPEQRILSKENFIYGLMLTVDRFITDEEDKKKMKEILEKIKKEPLQNQNSVV